MTDTLQGVLLERPDPEGSGVTVNGVAIEKMAGVGGSGGYEGADRVGRELATWSPDRRSADGILGRSEKETLDARGRDMTRNSGMMLGASNIYKDAIVGGQFRLNAKPNWYVLGLDQKWADEFQREVEAKFMLWAESPRNWPDASRKNNFTQLIRLAVGCFFTGGEVLLTSEWRPSFRYPSATCVQMIDCDRLSNPNEKMDDRFLRRGIQRNRYGEATHAWIRDGHPRDMMYPESRTWSKVPFYKAWGRLQVVHLMDQTRPDQTRGVAEMVAVLKETRMAKKFHEVALTNAIVQASYAATIESELPPDMAFESIGATEGSTSAAVSFLEAIAAFTRGGKNLEIDGVKIPYLFPGTKLNIRNPGQPGGVGTNFEESLHRYISAGLGVSYEEYSHDYSKSNYSSSRAAANNTRRVMLTKKSIVADGTANAIYSLWLEEAISNGQIESMKSIVAKNPLFFWQGINKEALCQATWIGASAGQVDEMKETQAAILRIKSGLSTAEIECAKLGNDYRDIFAQAAREKKLSESLGLDFNQDPTKPGTMSGEKGGKKDDGFDDASQDGKDKNGKSEKDDGFGED